MAMDLDRMRLLTNDSTTPNGHRLFKATLGTLASFIVLLLASSGASAATLDVVGGQLIGASGVLVDGSYYDVEFRDGTCVALYGGCDAVSDFTFQTEVVAVLASQALLDQVFLDVGPNTFDSDPELTSGCTSTFECWALTPFQPLGLGQFLAYARNDFGAGDVADGEVVSAAFDSSTEVFNVYAVWSPIPEPGTAVLMGLGLLGLSARNRREGAV
jgi:hypothetical protein